MGKLSIFLGSGLALVAVSAQAKTYVDAKAKTAIVYYMQGENVNASICNKVSVDQVPVTADDAAKAGCKPLSAKGLTLADIQAIMPQLKEAMNLGVGMIGNLMSGLGSFGNDPDMQSLGQTMSTTMTNNSKSAIADIKAEDVFREFKIEASTPTIEPAESETDINDRTEQFVALTTK